MRTGKSIEQLAREIGMSKPRKRRRVPLRHLHLPDSDTTFCGEHGERDIPPHGSGTVTCRECCAVVAEYRQHFNRQRFDPRPDHELIESD